MRHLIYTTALALLLVNQANAQGFGIAVNGNTVAGDDTLIEDRRALDEALQQADIQVSYQGLGAIPRLDLEVQEAGADALSLRAALNYPAFVTRAEIRIIDPDAVGGSRVISVLPVAPNGTVTYSPPRDGLLAQLRVYDGQGRFDETVVQPLDPRATRRVAEAEDGADTTARRRIPVGGGAIVVTGSDVLQGASVTALGEEVAVAPNGRFVIERILPPGEHAVDVTLTGQRDGVVIERDLTIPKSEWFYVATVDLTFGRFRDQGSPSGSYDDGRLAFYIEGRRADGTEIIASADSGEGPIEDIFRRLDDRDPRQRLLRVDPRDLYPTYGDDSIIEDRTPTSGNVFLRIERGDDFLQWGDFDAQLGDRSGYVNNDRTLYGLSAGYSTDAQTPEGEPRASVYAYAAQPDQLPQRDILRGTGGSIYFLERQDISRGTETISVQVRDGTTGRVLSSRQLVPGEDYEINYIQGVITLRQPLSSSLNDGIVRDGPEGSDDVVLVAQYEYTPGLGDLDGVAAGARSEIWLSNRLRVGISGLREDTGGQDQTLVGADITYQVSENTYLRFDIAESEGPGFGSSFSADGGLLFDTENGAAGSGGAAKLEGRADLTDLGLAVDGALSFYIERREEGFSGLDSQVTATTGDERFWGIAGDIQPRDGLRIAFALDDYENDAGERETEGTLEVEVALNDRLDLAVGVSHLDTNTIRGTTIGRGVRNGRRTDAAVRLTYDLGGGSEVYGFVQGTLEADGLEDNNRAGLGGTFKLGDRWTLTGEVSDGDLGFGAVALAEWADGDGSTRYAGWELDPNREVDGQLLEGDDGGVFKVGGRQRMSEEVSLFAEQIYDVFGSRTSLTRAYGAEWLPHEFFAASIAVEQGRVIDDRGNDFDRDGVSIGLRWGDEDLEAQARLEYRIDDGIRSGRALRTETVLLSSDLQWKINENNRVVASADYARTEGSGTPSLDGTYTDVSLGYAYRPVNNDRFNMLARYRYLRDEIGQRVDGVDQRGPRQRSHVFSVDALYDVNPVWTIGGKVGLRLGETAPDDLTPYAQNDATLLAVSARWHLVKKWDGLIEFRQLDLRQAEVTQTGVLAAVYRQVNQNVSVGLGYNFGEFSDDLTDQTLDDEGLFINLLAQF